MVASWWCHDGIMHGDCPGIPFAASKTKERCGRAIDQSCRGNPSQPLCLVCHKALLGVPLIQALRKGVVALPQGLAMIVECPGQSSGGVVGYVISGENVTDTGGAMSVFEVSAALLHPPTAMNDIS
jgi:hypothetical protein